MMNPLTRRACLATALVGLALPALAADLVIEQPWTRAAMQGGVGGAFMRLENHAAVGDRLVSAASPIARTVELHTSIRDGDVMRMRQVDAIEVPARGTVMLQPGGLHVMLIGLTAPLMAGTEVPLTLTFERAGAISVRLAVQAAGAPTMGGHGAAPAPRH